MQDSQDPRCRLPANRLAREEQARVVDKQVAIRKLAGSKDQSDGVGIGRGLDPLGFKTPVLSEPIHEFFKDREQGIIFEAHSPALTPN